MSTDDQQTSGEEPVLAGLTLARVGEVMAHVRHFPADASAEVLARLGLSASSWRAAIDAWMDELAGQAAREDPAAAAQLGSAYAATRDRLTAEQPTLDAIGLLPVLAEVAPIEAAQEPEPEEAIAVRAYELPTAGAAMLAGRASPPSSPWAADIAGTFAGELQVDRAVMPFDPKAAPLLPAESRTAHPVRSLIDLGGTLEAADDEPRPALPFAPAPAPFGYTLERYASLCVELAVDSNKVDEVLSRYRLTAEERAELDAYWRKRMTAEPRTWAAWDRAYRAYKTWFDAARRHPAC